MAAVFKPIQFAADGSVVAPGRLAVAFETSFPGGTIPSPLTMPTSGSDAGATNAASTQPGGGVDLITAATTNRRASIVGPAFDVSLAGGAIAVNVWAVVVTGRSATRGVALGATNDADTAGVMFRHTVAAPDDDGGEFYGYNTGAAVSKPDLNYSWAGGAPRRWFHSFWWCPRTGEVTIGPAPDQLSVNRTFTIAEAVPGTAVKPRIRCQTGEALSKTITVQRFGYAVYWL